jgi:hypothetical protein
MRLLLWGLASCFCITAGAQARYDHELELTETRFALESQIHGLKWGFLNNMDTGALGIGATGFVNLHTVWKGRPDQSSFLLQWKPSALWWSGDGLFGLTTGPFFTLVPKDSAVRATGYFFTIWKRDNVNAPFKFVVDAGMQMSQPMPVSAFVGTPVSKDEIRVTNIGQNKAGYIKSEPAVRSTAFKSNAGQQSLLEALNSFAADRSILIFSDYGKLPKNELSKVSDLNLKFQFLSKGAKELSGGCYYEWGQLKEHADSKTNPVTGYYVHVWQMEKNTAQLLAAVHRFDHGQKL